MYYLAKLILKTINFLKKKNPSITLILTTNTQKTHIKQNPSILKTNSKTINFYTTKEIQENTSRHRKKRTL